MKLQRLATLAFALAAAGAVHAQNLTVTGNIPFNFVVGGKTLPAGDYAVKEDFPSPTIIVRQAGGKTAVIVIAAYIEAAGPRESARLLFHRYGNRYFLSQIWVPGQSHTTLTPTHVERELSSRINREGEPILVALR